MQPPGGTSSFIEGSAGEGLGPTVTVPRLSKGAVCLIDDYCDLNINPDGWNYLPGVKKACDEFMADKAEQICYVYSGAFTHAFFRKSLA